LHRQARAPYAILLRKFMEGSTMNIASIFDWFAQDSRYAAAHADEPRQQDMWMKLADEWAAAAIRAVETSRDGADEVSSEASN
jgi:hypothetical protein